MRKPLAAAAAAALGSVALIGLAGPTTAATADAANVAIFHGVPGLDVDVYANGNKLLDNFAPGTLVEDQSIPAGTYDLQVFPADAADNSGTPAIEASGVQVPAGADATIVAHLSAEGAPTLTLFANDTSSVPAGQSRVTVRHTAAAPPVDVLAGGAPVFSGLANPNESAAEVPAGALADVAVAVAGTTAPVLGPTTLDLAEGTNTVVYAWGSAADGNLALATQTLSGLGSAPGGVPAGEAGLADTGLPAWALGLMAAAGLGVAVSARKLTTTAR